MEQYQILWRKTKRDKAEILRIYGSSARVFVPGELEGYQVEALAPYCFSSANHIPQGENILTHIEIQDGVKTEKRLEDGTWDIRNMKELGGGFVEEVVLPESLTTLGESAFYNCKKLRRLELGPLLQQIGSDAFMNTICFHEMLFCCGAGEKTGLKQILAQISSDMEVAFMGGHGMEAVLLYPEYYESYDEIAPAHLFGRSITGQGFRARQSFKEGVVEFAGYDAVFPQACVEETEKILSKMAFNRLRYPYALSGKNYKMYTDYLSGHVVSLAKRFIGERKLEYLRFLCQNKLLVGGGLLEAISYATELEWVEGVAELMRLNAGQKKQAGSRYEFEDF